MEIRVTDMTTGRTILTNFGMTERGARLKAAKLANIPYAWTNAHIVENAPPLTLATASPASRRVPCYCDSAYHPQGH